MAIGTANDFANRIRAGAPGGWFPAPPAAGEAETAPVLMGLLTGLGSVWAHVWTLLQYANRQTRIATSTGAFVDAVAADFFGPTGLPRKSGETDAVYIARIKAALFPVRSTRTAVVAAVKAVEGVAPAIIEPRNTGDTKGYGALAYPAAGGGYGYGTQGLAYGSLTTPFQFFLTAPANTSPANLYAAILPVLPAGAVAWVETPNRT